MEDLTFGEQVKIILGRKGMTIKQLAEVIEERTGKKMSRQNLTQRLGRDNFQEQDMRMIAQILGCSFHLSILGEAPSQAEPAAKTEDAPAAANVPAIADAPEIFETEPAADAPEAPASEAEQAKAAPEASAAEPASAQEKADAGGDSVEERDMTIGELYEIHRELSELEKSVEAGEPVENIRKELEEAKAKDAAQGAGQEQEDDFEPVISHNDAKEDREAGEVNPYTGREYQSNSVRMHPSRIGYVQVYDRTIHKWTDMTEWAFLGLQERKKALLGRNYEPPIYLD